MPKTPTDYSKSVIYKIEHLDKPELIYVGSTTNFTKRKFQHKYACNIENHIKHNYKLYQMIRANNGWDLFKIMIIKEFPCNSKIELLIEEEKLRKDLQATLNSNRCYRSIEENSKKQINKEYRDNNKEKIKEQKKEYRDKYKKQISLKKKNHLIVFVVLNIYYLINHDITIQ